MVLKSLLGLLGGVGGTRPPQLHDGASLLQSLVEEAVSVWLKGALVH